MLKTIEIDQIAIDLGRSFDQVKLPFYKAISQNDYSNVVINKTVSN